MPPVLTQLSGDFKKSQVRRGIFKWSDWAQVRKASVLPVRHGGKKGKTVTRGVSFHSASFTLRHNYSATAGRPKITAGNVRLQSVSCDPER